MTGKMFIVMLIVFLAVSSSVVAKIGGGDINFKGGKAGDVTFHHETHVKDANLACTVCHTKLYTTKEKHKKFTMSQMEKGRSCGVCHNGKKAFDVKSDCANCHQNHPKKH